MSATGRPYVDVAVVLVAGLVAWLGCLGVTWLWRAWTWRTLQRRGLAHVHRRDAAAQALARQHARRAAHPSATVPDVPVVWYTPEAPARLDDWPRP